MSCLTPSTLSPRSPPSVELLRRCVYVEVAGAPTPDKLWGRSLKPGITVRHDREEGKSRLYKRKKLPPIRTSLEWSGMCCLMAIQFRSGPCRRGNGRARASHRVVGLHHLYPKIRHFILTAPTGDGSLKVGDAVFGVFGTWLGGRCRQTMRTFSRPGGRSAPNADAAAHSALASAQESRAPPSSRLHNSNPMSRLAHSGHTTRV